MTLRSKVVRGSIWVVAFRWVARLLGLVNVAIIARILTPADFGLVAMAMLVISFVDAWLAFGLENACVQQRDLDREHLDAAWSMRFLQGLAVASLVAVAAPFAAVYFKDERVASLMWVLCFGVVVAGAGNIGVVLFRREMNFEAEFKFQFCSRLVGFFIGIGAALWLRNYWALVIGSLAGIVATTILSYAMHSYRPRWSLRRWRELWSFSKWMFIVNIAQFAEARVDEAMVGRLGADDLGLYVVASDLGQIPANEIAAPLNRVLFPALSTLQGEWERLSAAYLKMVEVVATLTLPAGAGLALVAKPLILVLLGPAWLAAAPILSLIAVFAVFRSLATTTTSLLFAVGRPRAAAYLALLGLATFAAMAWPLISIAGPQGAAISKLLAGAIVAAVAMLIASRICALRLRQLAVTIARPVIATAAMVAALLFLPDVQAESAVVTLLVLVVIGALVYGAVLLIAWAAMGRPDGPESMAMGAVVQRLSRR